MNLTRPQPPQTQGEGNREIIHGTSLSLRRDSNKRLMFRPSPKDQLNVDKLYVKSNGPSPSLQTNAWTERQRGNSHRGSLKDRKNASKLEQQQILADQPIIAPKNMPAFKPFRTPQQQAPAPWEDGRRGRQFHQQQHQKFHGQRHQQQQQRQGKIYQPKDEPKKKAMRVTAEDIKPSNLSSATLPIPMVKVVQSPPQKRASDIEIDLKRMLNIREGPSPPGLK